jgi:hypothetical protein
MSQHLRSLRRQRERGRRRVATVTAASAVGATTLAGVFAAVLAAGQPAQAATPVAVSASVVEPVGSLPTADNRDNSRLQPPAEAPRSTRSERPDAPSGGS